MKSISNSINDALRFRAIEIGKLQHIVMSALPASCQGHVNVAGVRDQQLILVTDSPIWANKLRLYRQSLIQTLGEHGNIQIANILIKQSPIERISPEPRPGKKRHLQRNTARLLDQTAEAITDPELKQALRKLARNTKAAD